MNRPFAEIVPFINKGGRSPAGCTPPVCQVYNEADDDEGRLMVNAILGLEVKLERLIRIEDESAVLAKRDELRAWLTGPMARVIERPAGA